MGPEGPLERPLLASENRAALVALRSEGAFTGCGCGGPEGHGRLYQRMLRINSDSSYVIHLPIMNIVGIGRRSEL